jgi:hypothetical protein
MFNITQRFIRTLALAALFTILFCLGLATSVSASVIDLGGAADYAVVGVGGSASVQSQFKIYQSATVINGNVAEGPYTTLTHNIDATVNGRWDYDTTDLNPLVVYPGSNVPSGGFHQIDLSGVAADARAAALAGSLFTPTQTFTTLNTFDGVGSINGTAGVNVIRITGDSAVKISLTLSGTATSSFIFQFTSPTTAGHTILSLSGMTMNIGAINPDNIYWDFNGLGGDVSITSMAAGQTVYGNFIAPDRNILSDHGIVVGRLIGGGSGSLLSIHSGSEITTPGTVPDGGSTLPLLGMALVSLGLVRFRKTTG